MRKTVSDNCHTVTFGVSTGSGDLHFLGRVFETCRRFRNSVAGKVNRRIMRLFQDTEYRSLKAGLSLAKKSGDDDDHVPSTELNQIRRRLTEIRIAYGLKDEYQVMKDSTAIRNRFFRKDLLPSNVSQTLVSDVWKGAAKVLFSTGRRLSEKRPEQFLSIRGKNNSANIVFNPVSMTLTVCGRTFPVMAKDDAYMRRELSLIRGAYRFECEHGEACKGCIRYCTVVRRLVNDHGTVRWGYWLKVMVDGPSVGKDRPAPAAERSGSRTLAIDPSQQQMAYCDDEGNCGFFLLDRRDPATEGMRAKVNCQMDQSRRASNPERYNPDGTYRKGSVNAETGRKSDWNETDNYRDKRRRKRLLLQKQGDTRRCRTAEICNRIARDYALVKSEDADYAALSARSKEVRREKDGRYASKRWFGRTVARFAPASFLAMLKKKVTCAGGEFVGVNPWTLKASRYDPTDDSYTKHRLSERIYRLSDGTHVQRDLFAAYAILHSRKSEETDTKGRRKTVDLPDRDAMLGRMDEFVPSMQQTMDRYAALSRIQAVPSSIGTGAWTALRACSRASAPAGNGGCAMAGEAHQTQEATIPAPPSSGGGKGRENPFWTQGRKDSAESCQPFLQPEGWDRTPPL